MRPSKPSLRSSESTPLSPEAPLTPFVRRFIKRVQNTVQKFALWQPGETFVVGVSGGPDSLCLLDVLFALSRKHAFTLHIAHVNYHLRGDAADLDQALVEAAAVRYGLPCSLFSYKPGKQTPSEERLRDVRYAFFEKLRQQTQATSIVVAHNQDDQAETLLLRLLRGAGLSGLAAMRPKNHHLIRPLIEMSRADIETYLKERGIVARTDASNADPRYFRNRIRHELLPFLEEHFQPQARKLLAETALLLGDDYALLETYATPFVVTKTASGIEFSSTALLALPDPLIRRELRTLLRPLLAEKNPEKNLLNELIKSLKSSKNKTQTVTFKGLKFVRKGDTVRLLHS